MKFLRKFYILILDNFIWLLVILLLLIGAFTIPKFFSLTNFINMAYHSSALAMMILGMSFCAISGHSDLSIESTFAFAPAIGILLMDQWIPGFPPSLALIITVIVGGLVGLVNGLIVVKLKINSFLVTLAMLIILRGLVLYLLPQGIYNIPKTYLFLGEAKIFDRIPVAIFIFLGIFILAHLIINNTFFGKNIVATGSNPFAAYISGININRIYIYVFIISGMAAAFGGILLVGRLGSILNEMGDGDILMVFAGTVLGGISLQGGVGKIINALGGALLLIIISTILNLSGVSPFLIKTIQGLLLLGAMILGNVREYLYKITVQKIINY
jgi:ribose/xylose/arabinose/galactoside ABC-type transport system permease subunit